ncbi:MAG: CHAD domain-containing protein [Algoriphagus sp.]|uniref:CHAD domain-containing protein n=1 Tax=Algoriphagus sp. TaxID=1872435 RepID=UPI0017AE8F36|nr:CHAD domain-containing protein [Algoriphagus sp.]NVJ85175.1 CHAD domain-containing protein [Algoriphagus sp.]
MEKSKFIKHYEGQVEAFLSYFNQAKEFPSTETVHQMRVSIKKLRAIWELSEELSHNSWKKTAHFSLISRLFKTAGAFREDQVHLKNIERLNDDCWFSFSEKLKESEKRNQLKFSDIILDFDIKKFKKLNTHWIEKFESIPDEIVTEKATSSIIRKHKKIQKINQKGGKSQELHQIRIYLKAIQEILVVLSKLNSNKKFEILENSVKALSHQLGKWHDYRDLLKSIKNFLNKSPKDEVSRSFKKSFKELKQEQKDRRKKVQKHLDKFLASNWIQILEQ